MYIPSDEEQITNDFMKELTKQLQKERQHHEAQLGMFTFLDSFEVDVANTFISRPLRPGRHQGDPEHPEDVPGALALPRKGWRRWCTFFGGRRVLEHHLVAEGEPQRGGDSRPSQRPAHVHGEDIITGLVLCCHNHVHVHHHQRGYRQASVIIPPGVYIPFPSLIF